MIASGSNCCAAIDTTLAAVSGEESFGHTRKGQTRPGGGAVVWTPRTEGSVLTNQSGCTLDNACMRNRRQTSFGRTAGFLFGVLLTSTFVVVACAPGPQTIERAADGPSNEATADSGPASDAAESAGEVPEVARVTSSLGEEWPTRVVCPQHYSWTMPITVINETAVPITLLAGDIDCADWSGEGTPATAMTGHTVPAGGREQFTVEPRNSYTRRWTMGLRFDDGHVGRFRLTIPVRAQPLIQVDDATPWQGHDHCWRIAVAPDPAASESPDLDRPFSFNTLRLTSDGSTIYAMRCWYSRSGVW